ncbi:hypothetical protein MA20_40665 [Bradyrhizobium japonicum]|uniref:Uncharacterized protein n=1 Tax=Bradyrhizobium japonicum TaxID=375 RepID=A0A0A3YK83_BRAJP|nr:hypothetical protein [Bradyrhizobium japonicum]KGT74108.1 hypothetical protein MA20_40665 [Bradyrhizobium japonicum]
MITASPLYSMIAALPQPSVCWTKWVDTTIFFENWSKLNSTHVQTQANAGVKIPEILAGAIHTILPEGRRLIVNVPVSQLDEPKQIERSYTVDKTKDDHPVVFAEHTADYAETFPAEPGYRIAGCTWHVETGNGASNIACAVNDTGAQARFTYKLTSGPAVDRYRGWLGATVNVSQILATQVPIDGHAFLTGLRFQRAASARPRFPAGSGDTRCPLLRACGRLRPPGSCFAAGEAAYPQSTTETCERVQGIWLSLRPRLLP